MNKRKNFIGFVLLYRKDLYIWAFLFMIYIVVTINAYLFYRFNGLYLLWGSILYICIFLSFYLESYLNYKRLFVAASYLHNNKLKFELEECLVKVIPKPVLTTIPKQNLQVKLQAKSYVVKAYSIKSERFFLLVYPVKRMGFLFQYACPLWISRHPVNLDRIKRLNHVPYSRVNSDGENYDIDLNGYSNKVSRLVILKYTDEA